jgi:hypothetical protein
MDAEKSRQILTLQGREVPLSWSPQYYLFLPSKYVIVICCSIADEIIEKVLSYAPFTDWVDSMNAISNEDPERPALLVDKVHIQFVDMFGKRLGFIKFAVNTFSTPPYYSTLLLHPTTPPYYSTLLLHPIHRLLQGNGTRK